MHEVPGFDPSDQIKTAQQFSAGAAVYRPAHGGFEVLIIQPAGRHVWCLPKGALDREESPEEAALREVKEETGVESKIEQNLGKISYWYFWKENQTLYKKTVQFYLSRYTAGSLDQHDWEVSAVRWVSLEEAEENLSYQSEREVLAKARTALLEKAG